MQRALAAYGRHLGTAFQLIDDVLDYRSDPDARGKNLGEDLAEGKPTLPLIHALRMPMRRRPAADPLARSAGQGGRDQTSGKCSPPLNRPGALQYTARLAQAEADQALAALAAVAGIAVPGWHSPRWPASPIERKH